MALSVPMILAALLAQSGQPQTATAQQYQAHMTARVLNSNGRTQGEQFNIKKDIRGRRTYTQKPAPRIHQPK